MVRLSRTQDALSTCSTSLFCAHNVSSTRRFDARVLIDLGHSPANTQKTWPPFPSRMLWDKTSHFLHLLKAGLVYNRQTFRCTMSSTNAEQPRQLIKYCGKAKSSIKETRCPLGFYYAKEATMYLCFVIFQTCRPLWILISTNFGIHDITIPAASHYNVTTYTRSP